MSITFPTSAPAAMPTRVAPRRNATCGLIDRVAIPLTKLMKVAVAAVVDMPGT